MSTQTVKTRLVTLLQTASILHELLTNPACYFRRKVPGKMLHLDMPFHWKHLLTTKRTLLTLATCSWGHLSTPLYHRWSAAYHRGINCCSRGTCPSLCTSNEVVSTTGTTAGVAAICAWVRGPIWPSPDTSRDDNSPPEHPQQELLDSMADPSAAPYGLRMTQFQTPS